MKPEDILNASDEALADLLARFDSDETSGRIRRLKEINEILALGAGEGFWHSGGEEATWLLGEAKDCYVYGFPLASLLASHAACERRLAGIMASYPDDQVPSDWQTWGLSRLVKWTRAHGHLPEGFERRLRELAVRRNALSHYRRPLATDSATYRTIGGTGVYGADDDTDDLVATLEVDAREGLRTAYELHAALSGYP